MINYELKEKIDFVKDLKKAIIGRISQIEDIRYMVFEHKLSGATEEYLEITYKGGHRQVRCCTINSMLAIFTELEVMCRYSSKYNDIDSMMRKMKDTNWDLYL